MSSQTLSPTPLSVAGAPYGLSAVARTPEAEDKALREVAREFEQVFIAQMLKQAKIGENNSAFSGGYGEEAYQSFLVDEYAGALTRAESFGLAEHIYAQLKEKAQAHAE